MAKLIIVTLEQLKASQKKWEEIKSKDPAIQEMEKEMDKWVRQEKARRDAEFAHKRKEKSVIGGV